MDYYDKKRQRCASFSSDERIFIANVCAKYKHILENKKTDHITSDAKKTTWEKIASEVNSAAINYTYRSPDVLKRFYENRKREVRKIAAEEKKEMKGTGGGPYINFVKEPCHDVILSVMNPKTVYGLQNNFDGDAEPEAEPKQALKEPTNPSEMNSVNEIEIIYESNDTVDNENDKESWKKYVPSDLKKPISSSLVNFSNKQSEILNTAQRDQEINVATPTAEKKKELSSSRRRPTSEIKSLTRSDIAEKYNKLLDDRLVITGYQKKKLEEELVTIEGERKLKYELLQLQIEVEKEKLKQLQKSSFY